MSDVAAPPLKPAHWMEAPILKLGLILVLVLLMQVPLLAVGSLIDERQSRLEEVQNGIRRSWGPAQAVTAPTLAIPFTYVEPATPTAAAQRYRSWVQVPAHNVAITASLAPETRQRGLFHATVYTAELQIAGTVTVPPIQLHNAPNAEILWDQAVLAIGATDLRGQPGDATVMIDGRPVHSVIRTVGGPCGATTAAVVPLAGADASGRTIAFQAGFTLRGMQSLYVVPWGEQISLHISAPWQTPSFNGVALPLSYDNDGTGFRADWKVTGNQVNSSNGVEDGYSTGPNPIPACSLPDVENQFGVDLLEAVPTYLMVTRTAKYGTLFLALSFLTYFIMEQGTRIRIHLAQYGLLGLSVSMFALMLVALAEPLGFTAGYVLATLAVMGQASVYTFSVTGRARLALLFAGVLALLFALLYVILRLENYALLAGTAALFAILSVVMAATRRIDWSGMARG